MELPCVQLQVWLITIGVFEGRRWAGMEFSMEKHVGGQSICFSFINSRSQLWSFVWDVALCRWVVCARRLATLWFIGPSTVVGKTTTLSRNVGYQSPSDALSHSNRTETSTSPLRKPENVHMPRCIEWMIRWAVDNESERMLKKAVVLKGCERKRSY
jgi:hypothetical protein